MRNAECGIHSTIRKSKRAIIRSEHSAFRIPHFAFIMLNPLDLFVAGEIVNRALNEDVGRGDITSRSIVRFGLNARCSFIAKQDLVLAGLEVADLVFGWFDEYIQIESTAADGDEINSGKIFARVIGDA